MQPIEYISVFSVNNGISSSITYLAIYLISKYSLSNYKSKSIRTGTCVSPSISILLGCKLQKITSC